MAKAPRAGAVKTRLAQALASPALVDLYCCLLADTLELAKSLDGADVAIVCPVTDADDLARVVNDEITVVPQTGEGLAAGLTSVFARFTTDRRRVIAFDTDTPHLPRTVLQSAFHALGSCDLVVGPTDDGGYYLVGAKASYPGLFAARGIGTASALGELLTRARAMELSVRLTDTFYDIDVPADLSRLAAELDNFANQAPRTAAWLRNWLAAGSAT
jgi:rSAM/selenodomain-associated transferase 1